MSKMFEHPVILLLITGTFLGLNLPLGMLASQASVSPVFWALIVSLGVCLLLFPKLLIQKDLNFPIGKVLRYVIISGTISYIIPNLLLYTVMAQLGSGYMGIMYALSPVFTLGLAVTFNMKIPSGIGILGIAIGLIGAFLISYNKGSDINIPSVLWVFAALGVPVCLAVGNIYRTLDWPENTSPDSLAFWSHGFATLLFLSFFVTSNDTGIASQISYAPFIIVLQIIISGMTFPLFFRLQKVAGPVILSQIGYVAAAVSLFSATVFLGEFYSMMTWAGASIIAIGIVLSIKAQINQ